MTGNAPVRLARMKVRRGTALLPSLFTTANLFSGFWSMIHTLHGRYEQAAVLIGIAIVLDMLDGRIARLTNTTSEFGAELDSLSDVISFGVAPALLAYAWAFSTIERAGWLAAFLFVVCGALRLARFNVQRKATDGRYFVGLAIPAAAGQVAAVVYAVPQGIDLKTLALIAWCAVVVLALLMVSTFRYHSFKGFDLRTRRSYMSVLAIAALLVLVAIEPQATLLVLATAYALSGPLGYLATLPRRRRKSEAQPEPDGVPADHSL